MGLFDIFKKGLSRSNEKLGEGLNRAFSREKVDEDLYEELEEELILADVGMTTAMALCEELRRRVKANRVTLAADARELLKAQIAEILSSQSSAVLEEGKTNILMVIGVNGAGKTTSIGKLAYRYRSEGHSVLLAAADTFRAAAIDQLGVWAERAGVPMIRREEGSDPGAVVYEAAAAAHASGADVLICDTAGRLHNKKNLMEELAKLGRILEREFPDAHREVLLVLDGGTGQNALVQAKLFAEACPITGLILTKLDGSAKGGVVIGIMNELGIPVKYIGLGEGLEDLMPFDAESFASALLGEASGEAEG